MKLKTSQCVRSVVTSQGPRVRPRALSNPFSKDATRFISLRPTLPLAITKASGRATA